MKKLNLKLANNIGLIDSTNFTNKDFVKKISDSLQKKIASDSKNFDELGLLLQKYRASNGVDIYGYENLLKFIENPSNGALQVYPNYIKKFDMALEGGGTFGFAHIGAIHAYALKCIGADRFSGTSAGAIVAALMAGGYQVDLNYKVNTIKPIGNLLPNKDNSLNKILFESDLSGFADINLDDNDLKDLIKNSFFSKMLRSIIHAIIDECVKKHFHELNINLDDLKRSLIANINLIIDKIPNLLNQDFKPSDGDSRKLKPYLKDEIKKIINSVFNIGTDGVNTLKEIQEIIFKQVGELIISLVEIKIQELIFIGNLLSSEVNSIAISFLSLVERGGLWEGNAIRDWVESHLQVKNKKPGSGVILDGSSDNGIKRPKILRKDGTLAKAILFKDLDFDLCITATSVGISGRDYSNRKDGLIYFSKKTSPDYPVAEAVRRSLSLPFAFLPRTLSDGYTNNAKVFKTSDFNQSQYVEEKGIFLGGAKIITDKDLLKPVLPTPTLDVVPGRTSTHTTTSSLEKHKYGEVSQNSLCQDGAFFVNVPISVFRDLDNEVFTCTIDSDGNFNKTVIISNLNQGAEASNRPFDIPLPKGDGFDLIKIINGFTIAPGEVLRGGEKLKLVVGNFINSTALGEWKEFEINLLMNLIPNALISESNLLDPIEGDLRLSSLSFDMATTTKKWMLKCGFDGAKKSIEEMIEMKPALKANFNIGNTVDPYLHILSLTDLKIATATSSAINGASIVPGVYSKDLLFTHNGGESPLMENDTVFIGDNVTKIVNTIIPPNFINPSIENRIGKSISISEDMSTYSGAGYTIIKVEKNAFNTTNADENWLSFKSNLTVQVTLLLDKMPSNLDDYTLDTTFQVSLKGTFNSQTKLYAFSKIHTEEEIVIPGTRKFYSGTSNKIPLIVLVRPV